MILLTYLLSAQIGHIVLWYPYESLMAVGTYSRIQLYKKKPTKRRYAMNTHKIGQIKRTDRSRSTELLTQGDSPTVHSRYTHRSSALPEGPLGGLPSLSLTIKGSWVHVWERVAKPLVSSLTPVPP